MSPAPPATSAAVGQAQAQPDAGGLLVDLHRTGQKSPLPATRRSVWPRGGGSCCGATNQRPAAGHHGGHVDPGVRTLTACFDRRVKGWRLLIGSLTLTGVQCVGSAY